MLQLVDHAGDGVAEVASISRRIVPRAMHLQTGQLGNTIAYLDNGLLDTPGVGTTYLVRGDDIAIVETGTSLCAPTIVEGLQVLGVRAEAVRHIVLTHVHMDHAGGAGVLAQAMPEARVYIHSLTAQHLVDPSRLLPSAERALGDLFARHGTIVPLPAERLGPAETLDLDLGAGVRLQAVATPGHSPDHLSYYEPSSGALFAGDSIGISLPAFGYHGPVTPPPAYDVGAQLATFDKLLEMPLDRLLFSHWGPSHEPPQAMIRRLKADFEHFDELVRSSLEQEHIDEAAIIRAMLPRHPLPPAGEWVIAGWVAMSIKGLQRYYTRRKPA
jgi:glyoxylase-like metal-dependent hydrolase (beta-lactamase superfamily II)